MRRGHSPAENAVPVYLSLYLRLYLHPYLLHCACVICTLPGTSALTVGCRGGTNAALCYAPALAPAFGRYCLPCIFGCLLLRYQTSTTGSAAEYHNLPPKLTQPHGPACTQSLGVSCAAIDNGEVYGKPDAQHAARVPPPGQDCLQCRRDGVVPNSAPRNEMAAADRTDHPHPGDCRSPIIVRKGPNMPRGKNALLHCGLMAGWALFLVCLFLLAAGPFFETMSCCASHSRTADGSDLQLPQTGNPDRTAKQPFWLHEAALCSVVRQEA